MSDRTFKSASGAILTDCLFLAEAVGRIEGLIHSDLMPYKNPQLHRDTLRFNSIRWHAKKRASGEPVRNTALQKTYMLAYRAAHLSELKAADRFRNSIKSENRKRSVFLFLLLNLEAILLQNDIRTAAKKDRKRSQLRVAYARDPEKFKKRVKAFGILHPDMLRSIGHKYRALRKNATIGDVGIIKIWETKWNSRKWSKCYWCGAKTLSSKCHSDHIIALAIGGHHSVENLCISCASCNCSKKSSPMPVWNSRISQPVLL